MTKQKPPEDQALLVHLLSSDAAGSKMQVYNESDQLDSTAYNKLKDEYSEANQYLRHYSNLRFAAISVFFFVIGGIATFAFDNNQHTQYAITVARFAGLLSTLVFWSFEERISQSYIHFNRTASEIEQRLGYKQISTRPRGGIPILAAYQTSRVFYIILTTFWSYIVIFNPQ